MPVTTLYCEGRNQGVDMRVIRQLLPKECQVKALGGKTIEFMNSIVADRSINPCLAGLVDHDFDCRELVLRQHPTCWFHQTVQIGWTWERKEIENYLIDPIIVSQALNKPEEWIREYQSALNRAAESIATYTAARTALSCCGFRNNWGESVSDTYFSTRYQFPKMPGKKACQEQIRQIVEEYRRDRIMKPENVLQKFDDLRALFRPQGYRLANLLTFFSGKDLLAAMRQPLIDLGFDFDNPIKQFVERIVNRMEQIEEVWMWLPEWRTLRELIINTQSF